MLLTLETFLTVLKQQVVEHHQLVQYLQEEQIVVVKISLIIGKLQLLETQLILVIAPYQNMVVVLLQMVMEV